MKRFALLISLTLLLLLSCNIKAQWVKTNGLYGDVVTVNCFSVNDSNVFAGTDSGVVVLNSKTKVWTQAPFQPLLPVPIWIESFVQDGSYMFAGTMANGVFKSTNNGKTWPLNNKLEGLSVLSLVLIPGDTVSGLGSKLFAGTSGGMYISTDNGTNWTGINNGLTDTSGSILPVITLAIIPNGTSPAGAGGTNIFAGTIRHGVYLSTDFGTSWKQTGLQGKYIWSLAANGTDLFAAELGNALYLSTNNGISWAEKDSGLYQDVQALTFGNNGTNTQGTGGAMIFAATGAGVYLSTNNGSSWAPTGGPYQTQAIAMHGTDLYTATWDNGIFLSTDYGSNWTRINSGLRMLNEDMSVTSFTAKGSNLYAGDGDFGVFLTTNDGTSWTQTGNAISGRWDPNVQALTVKDSCLFEGTYEDGVYISTDNGNSWIQNTPVLINADATGFAVAGSNLFAAINGVVYLSTNDGVNWCQRDTGLSNTQVNTLLIKGANLFAGAIDGVYLSTNNGINWTETSLSNTYVNALAFSDSNLFAGTKSNGVFLSTDNGVIWRNTGLKDTTINALTIIGSNMPAPNGTGSQASLFAGTTNGIYYSKNNNTWINANKGLPSNTSTFSLFVHDSLLFAGTSAGVWRRSISEILTGINDKQNNLLSSFKLEQNYPNPFNPSTVISWQLAVGNFVTLKVYDVLGREVKTLVNERQNAGVHSVTFNAEGLPSGVYFYRINAGNFTDVKKLMILR